MKKEANMNTIIQVISDMKATMTPAEFRNEMLASLAFLIVAPILFTAFWVITPA
jgi:hypothetical protein